jgi:hypothetical protein
VSDIQPFFSTPVGSNRWLGFQLRLYGTSDGWNVSGASQIILEWEIHDAPEGQTPPAPLVASPSSIYANWAAGFVPIFGTPNDIFAVIATIDFTLVVFTADGQTIPSCQGSIEVLPRPGFAAT